MRIFIGLLFFLSFGTAQAVQCTQGEIQDVTPNSVTYKFADIIPSARAQMKSGTSIVFLNPYYEILRSDSSSIYYAVSSHDRGYCAFLKGSRVVGNKNANSWDKVDRKKFPSNIEGVMNIEWNLNIANIWDLKNISSVFVSITCEIPEID